MNKKEEVKKEIVEELEPKGKQPTYIIYYERKNEENKVDRYRVGAVWENEKNGEKRLRISIEIFGNKAYLSAYLNKPKETKEQKQ